MKKLLMTAALAAALAIPSMAWGQSYTPPPGAKVATLAVEGPLSYFSLPGTSTAREVSYFNMDELKGKKIVGIEVYGLMTPDGKTYQEAGIYNQALYITKGNDVTKSQSWFNYSDVRDNGVMYAPINEGIDVPTDGFFAGWWMDGSSRIENPFIACADGVGTPGGIWARHFRDTEWTNLSETKGPVPVKVYYCDEVPAVTGDVSISAVGDVVIASGQSAQVSTTLTNNSWAAVTGYSYVVDVDGKQLGDEFTQEYDGWGGYPFGPGMSEAVVLDLPAMEAGSHTVTIKVNQVSGMDNISPNSSVTFTVNAVNGDVQCPANCMRASLVGGGKTEDLGVGSTNINVATRYANAKFRGLKVVGAELSGLRLKGLTNFSLWCRNSLTGENVASKPGLQYGDHVAVLFDTPIEITEDGPYFGATFDIIGGDNWPIPVGGPQGLTGSCYGLNSNGVWKDLSSYGCLMMTLFVESANIPDNSLELKKVVGNTIFGINKPFDLKLQLVNYGKKPVEKITYAAVMEGLGGLEGESSAVTPVAAIYGAQQDVKFSVAGIPVTGNLSGTLSAPTVNGEANPYASVTIPLKLNMVEKMAQKRPIFEEYTGTGCGYCPRGILAMSKLADEIPDFIGAVYHLFGHDPMYPEGVTLPWGSDGAPDANIDRTGQIDPYYGSGKDDFGVFADFEAAQENITPAVIELKADWNQDTKTVKVHSLTRFAFAEAGAKYKIGYIFTADKLTGSGSGWAQSNYYSGDESLTGTPLEVLANGTFDLSVYHDVVLEGSVPQGSYTFPNPVEIGKDYADTLSVSFKDNDLVTTADNLNVIAVVVDPSTSKVRNAVTVKAGHATMDGEFPDPGQEEQNPDTPIEFSYMPAEYSYSGTGGSGFGSGRTGAIGMGLTDSVINVYKGYQLIGVRAPHFSESTIDGITDVSVFAMPFEDNESNNYMHTIDITPAKIKTDATLKAVDPNNQCIEGYFDTPLVIGQQNILLGYVMTVAEGHTLNYPVPYCTNAVHPMGFYMGWDGELYYYGYESVVDIFALLKAPGGATEIVEVPLVQQNAEIYYDLTGRRVSNPGHGVFIKKSANTTTKVIR